MNELAGKIALVTGASRGIGAAIAKNLAENGATVIGTATSEASVAKITTGVGMILDISSPQSIEDFFAKLNDTYGMPNILVNNAGITKDNLFMRMTDEQWQQVIDTNLTGVYRLTRACIRAMVKARFGRIINISSVVACTGNAGQANYCAAKAGVIGFTKSLAQEIASRGITVNAVAPGFIATDMTKELNDVQRQQIISQVPIGKMGRVEDIAAAVEFLASEKASYITGETLHVNGGMFMS